MSALQWMHVLQGQPYARAIAQSGWLFPALETLHVMSLVLVVGSVGIVDVRLLGVGFRDRSVRELCGSVLPWTWAAFCIAAACGALLFSSKASLYFENLPFRLKMLGLLLAGLNMAVFHLVTLRDLDRWDRGAPPLRVRLTGGCSLLLWVGIVAAGRWIGFTS